MKIVFIISYCLSSLVVLYILIKYNRKHKWDKVPAGVAIITSILWPVVILCFMFWLIAQSKVEKVVNYIEGRKE